MEQELKEKAIQSISISEVILKNIYKEYKH